MNPSPRAPWRAPLAIFATALATRLAYVAELADHDLFAVLLGDARSFDAHARAIAAGDWIGRGAFYQAPGYAYFLGTVYTIFGESTLAARIVQAFLGAAACALVTDATSRVATPRAGWIAGLLLALHAPAIHLDGSLQKAGPSLFGVALLLAVLARHAAGPRARTALFAGVLLGALALTRENLIVLAPLVALWMLLARAPALIRVKTLGALVAGGVLAFAPVAVRNHLAGTDVLAAHSNLGPNLWIGNHAGADGLFTALRPGRSSPGEERIDAREIAEAEVGRRLSGGEVSAFWRDRAVDWMRSEPAAASALFGRKLRLLFHDREWMDSQAYDFHRRESRVLGVLGIPFRNGVLVALAAAGLVMAWGERRRLAFHYAALAVLAVSVASFFVFGRFRAGLLPFLATFAGIGLAGLRVPPVRLVVPGIASALAALVVFVPAGVDDDPIAATHSNLGSALRDAGREADAEAHFRAALARGDDYADPHFNLALVLVGRGDDAGARRHFARAAELEPLYAAEAVLVLGAADLERGDVESARARLGALPRDGLAPDVLHRLGILLRRAGDPEGAETAYLAALSARDFAAARNDLGWLYRTTGRWAEAAAEYERALELDAGFRPALFNLGSLRAAAPHTALRDGDRALELAGRAALELGDDHPAVLDLRALALAELGRYPEAASAARRGASRALREGDAGFARVLTERAALYAAGRPFRWPR